MVKIAFDPIYAHPLPENHRFPMMKYELIPEQLIHEGTCSEINFFNPGSCSKEIVLFTHVEAGFICYFNFVFNIVSRLFVNGSYW